MTRDLLSTAEKFGGMASFLLGESPDVSAKNYWTKYSFKIIALNNEGALMNGCPNNWPEETKTLKQP
jgi:hypothetical protein